MPDRIQLRRKKGWRLPSNAVSVARPGRWGNPYRIGDAGVPDAVTAVTKYRDWVAAHEVTLQVIRDDLAGKHLACWCRPDQPCHADVLLELANAE